MFRCRPAWLPIDEFHRPAWYANCWSPRRDARAFLRDDGPSSLLPGRCPLALPPGCHNLDFYRCWARFFRFALFRLGNWQILSGKCLDAAFNLFNLSQPSIEIIALLLVPFIQRFKFLRVPQIHLEMAMRQLS